MKTIYFFFIFIILFFSCNEENEIVMGDEGLNNSSQQLEQAKLAINAMGLDTTFISEWDKYYVVEGDILICKDSLNNSMATTRQYRTTYYTNNYRTISIGADNTIAMNTNWREAIREVIKIYNDNTGLNFIYNENNPDITITKSFIPGTNVCARGTFPSSSANVGNMISINTGFYSNIDTFLSLKEKIFLLMHELGHNLGLRHTDGSSEGDGGVGLIQIPGTPTSDSNSFMNSTICGLSWSGLSEYDLVTFKFLWPRCIIFFPETNSQMTVNYGSYLDRYVVPQGHGSEIFSGWYEDENLTIPWKYSKEIIGDITLYAKWRSKGQTTKIEDSSDTSYNQTFTLTQTTAVTLTVEVGRGLNEWWEISQYINGTGAVLGKESTIFVKIYMEPYIWNANPGTYISHTEEPIVLDPGTYWLSASFTRQLGLQYGASGKHGVTRAIVQY